MLHDKDIREPLFDFLEDTYGKIRIIEEKTIGESRADVVMLLEEALVGIEIKSDADTYRRLAGQVKDYDRFYDYNYVVVGTSHALHIKEHIPEYWGVITVEEVDNALDFYIYRQPLQNPKITWQNKLEILWRPELALLQEWNGLPKYKEKSKSFVAAKISEKIESGKLDEAELKKQISTILFERDYNNVEAMLKEYRRSETEKMLEQETDPEKQVKLIEKKLQAKQNLKSIKKKRRRRRAKL